MHTACPCTTASMPSRLAVPLCLSLHGTECMPCRCTKPSVQAGKSPAKLVTHIGRTLHITAGRNITVLHRSCDLTWHDYSALADHCCYFFCTPNCTGHSKKVTSVQDKGATLLRRQTKPSHCKLPHRTHQGKASMQHGPAVCLMYVPAAAEPVSCMLLTLTWTSCAVLRWPRLRHMSDGKLVNSSPPAILHCTGH
jgi:hypothetical protein